MQSDKPGRLATIPRSADLNGFGFNQKNTPSQRELGTIGCQKASARNSFSVDPNVTARVDLLLTYRSRRGDVEPTTA